MAETPGTMEILEQFWEYKTNSMWTAYPAKVIAYSNRFATIQPLIKYKIKDKDGLRSIPNVQDVPVIQPASQFGSINMPNLVGTNGLAIVTNRDVSGWIQSEGSAIFPTETRKWDISDSFFIPGVFPLLDPYKGIVDDGVLDINVVAGTKMKIGNGVVELLDLFDQLLTLLLGPVDAVGVSSTGTNSLILAQLAILKTSLGLIKAP